MTLPFSPLTRPHWIRLTLVSCFASLCGSAFLASQTPAEPPPALPPYLSLALDPAAPYARYAESPRRLLLDLEVLREGAAEGYFSAEMDLATWHAAAAEGEAVNRDLAEAVTIARLGAMGTFLSKILEREDGVLRDAQLELGLTWFGDLVGRLLPAPIALEHNRVLVETARAVASDTVTEETLGRARAALRQAGHNPFAWTLLANAVFAHAPEAPETALEVIRLCDLALALTPELVDARLLRWATQTGREAYAEALADGYWLLENAEQVLREDQWEHLRSIQPAMALTLLQARLETDPDDGWIDSQMRDFLLHFSPGAESELFAQRLNQTRDPVGRARYLLWQRGFGPRDFRSLRAELERLATGEDETAAQTLANLTVQAHPQSARAHLFRADFYYALGEAVPAIEDADAALRLDPTLADASILKVRIFSAVGLQDRIEGVLERAIQLAPTNPVLRYLRADHRASLDRLADALVDLDVAIAHALPAEQATLHLLRGRIRFALGEDLQGAGDDLLFAVENGTPNADAAFQTGQLMVAEGRLADARRCFTIAREAGHPEAEAALDRLP